MEPPKRETPTVIGWQKGLLPVMIGMLAALTLFFFIASFVQLYYLHSRIEDYPKLDLYPALGMTGKVKSGTKSEDKLDFARWKTLSILEGNALARRYHQANVSLMSRIWTRYLGFVTGMILALVGAAFILGKLREPATELEVKGEHVGKFSITSASPGLVLALLGTILMVTTLVTHHEIEVKDSPLYMSAFVQSVAPQAAVHTAPPKPLKPLSDNDILRDMKKKLPIKEPK